MVVVVRRGRPRCDALPPPIRSRLRRNCNRHFDKLGHFPPHPADDDEIDYDRGRRRSHPPSVARHRPLPRVIDEVEMDDDDDNDDG